MTDEQRSEVAEKQVSVEEFFTDDVLALIDAGMPMPVFYAGPTKVDPPLTPTPPEDK